MAITNTWNVVQMDCYPQQDGEKDVVFNVHWDLNGTDGEHFGRVYGSVGISLDPEAPFTPYSELTNEQVIGWVKNTLGAERVEQLENSVAQQISEQKNPTVVNPPLPWATN